MSVIMLASHGFRKGLGSFLAPIGHEFAFLAVTDLEVLVGRQCVSTHTHDQPSCNGETEEQRIRGRVTKPSLCKAENENEKERETHSEPTVNGLERECYF